MGVVQELLQLSPIDWFVVGLATFTCLVGALLPRLGNLLGRLMLGEDPLLARWQAARKAKREKGLQIKAARKASKASRQIGVSQPPADLP